MGLLRFNDSFWSQDYLSGLERLFEILFGRTEELDQLCKFVADLVLFEKKLGNTLLKLNDDGKAQRLANGDIDEVIDRLHSSAQTNLKLAQLLERSNLLNLRKFAVEHRETLKKESDNIFKAVKIFEDMVSLYEKSRQIFEQKYQELRQTNESLELEDSSLDLILKQVQKEVRDENEKLYTEESDDYKLSVLQIKKSELRKVLVELLQLHTDKDYVIKGLELSEFIDATYELSFKEVEDFKFDLVKNGFIKVFEGNGISTNYQWTDKTLKFVDLGMDLASLQLDDSRRIRASILEFEELKKAQFQMFLEVDKCRCDLDSTIMLTLNALEELEFKRREKMRQCLEDLSSLIPGFEPKVDTVQDLQKFIMKYRFGFYRPRQIPFTSFKKLYEFENFTQNQIFGSDLVELTIKEDKTIPAIIYACLKHIDGIKSDSEVWEHSMIDSETFKLREEIVEITKSEKKYWSKKFVNTKILPLFQKYEPETVISIIKLFFLELPEPLIEYGDIPSEITDDSVAHAVDSLRTEYKDTLASLVSRFTDKKELHDVISKNLSHVLTNCEPAQDANCQIFIKKMLSHGSIF
ncbi:unnamed protein product [Kuraishia capsulata CBS 1993]|uniref:Rho-GAP domain-containing protein n=1 Tax=Kuraishia capsulata CBS 1993 TaxID=1382522 RepID=W6MP83_9ASCO|nr:uncharacterized protein KUCA_T00004428001 [Kuraishia capsulata CBS 1993]CDK28446.1 unnamed protein product [Kuraishia capsulata CBS 1993]